MEVRHEDANRASIYDTRPTDLDAGGLRGFSGRMPRSLVLGVGEKRIEARATELSRCEMPNLGAPRSLPQIRPAAVGIASVVGWRNRRARLGLRVRGRPCPFDFDSTAIGTQRGHRTPNPQLPDGVDEDEYRRIRDLMRASVLHVWRKGDVVIAGIDTWDVVDEAWVSMAKSGFRCKGPFLPFALRVARNKAIDALKRAEIRRGSESMDAPLPSGEHGEDLTLHDVVQGSEGSEVIYLDGLDEVAVAEKVARYEEAIYQEGVLTDLERHIFLSVRGDRKSGAAVGRDLPSPLSGQRVGQIVVEAFIKIDEHVRKKEVAADAAATHIGGGDTDGVK